MHPQRPRNPPLLRAVPKPPASDPPEPSSDDVLIEAVVAGDSRVAGQLYSRLVGIVDRTLYRVFGRREPDHDDLVQATFEQIVLTLTKRRYARACSLNSWASTVASHVALNALRARRRERRVISWGEDIESPLKTPRTKTDVEHEAGLRQEIDRVRYHLATMSPDKATTLLLYDVLGHDLSEIAVLTGVSVAAAQSRLVRGRKELLHKLESDGHGEATRAERAAGGGES
jgi:RNA polymerase sigma-70 factor (ECF subfamily)